MLRTHFRSFGRTDGRTDNVKTVYPPTNTVCGGYKYSETILTYFMETKGVNEIGVEKKTKRE